MCEYLFGQCASGPVFKHRNVRVLVWSMCEWSGHNVRVTGYVPVEMCEWSGHNVRVFRS